jgi:hypothetical protein
LLSHHEQIASARRDFSIDPMPRQLIEKNLGQMRIQLGAGVAIVTLAAIERDRGGGARSFHIPVW